jgi:hypothetical protein
MQMQMTTIERISEGENLSKKESMPAAEPGDEEAQGPDENSPADTPTNEPQTQTDTTTEPLTVKIDVERDGGRQTLTDIHVDTVLQPVFEDIFSRLVRRERYKAADKYRGPTMGRDSRIQWVRSVEGEQRQAAIKAFGPVVAAYANLTGVTTDAADWVTAYLAGLPGRVEQAISRTDPGQWYCTVEDRTVSELVGTAKAFARENTR